MTQKLSTEERKKEIISAALKLIDQEGFSKLTIRKIAEKNQISEAAVYRHFNSKKEIMEHLIDYIFQNNPVITILQEKKDNLFSLLYKAMEKQLQWIEENPEISGVLFQEEIFLEYPEIRDKFNAYRKKKEKTLIELLSSAQNRGLISKDIDSQTFALLYMGAIRVSVLRWRSEESPYSLPEQTGPVTGALFKLLR